MGSGARFVGLLGILAGMLCTSCTLLAGLVGSPDGIRTLHVKVVADPTFATTGAWRTNAQRLVEAASQCYSSWFDIRFVIDTMEVWSFDSAPCHGTLLDEDCLVRSIPKGTSDMVIIFGKDGSEREPNSLGYPLARHGYVVVTQRSWTQSRAGYTSAYLALIHEIGHVFGAVHIYKQDNGTERYVMEPSLGEKFFERTELGHELKMPDFHPATVVIINALRNRPFSGDQWDQALWPEIRRAYRLMRNEYCNFRIESGMLQNHEMNVAYQNELYYYLALWAQACGKYPLAEKFCDSIGLVSDAMLSTCQQIESGRRSKLCMGIGYYPESQSVWTKRNELGRRWLAAEIQLSMGNVPQADALLDTTVAAMHGLPVQTQEKLRASYQLLKARYRPAEPPSKVVLPDASISRAAEPAISSDAVQSDTESVIVNKPALPSDSVSVDTSGMPPTRREPPDSAVPTDNSARPIAPRPAPFDTVETIFIE